MKILHIADQPPGYFSGGQLGILQFSYVWTRLGSEVDYVGPMIEDNEIESWYCQTYYLNTPLNKIQKILSLFHLQFDRKYMSWKKLTLDFKKYDIIYIDFTKMDFALRDIRKSNYCGRIIVRAHNVEADFFKVNFMTNKTFMNFLKYIVAKPREQYMVKHSDYILAITEEDKLRIKELYHISDSKIKICPVGVNLPKKNIKFKTKIGRKIKCLITGSLWFGPNAEATKWFVANVYPKVKEICELTIAGYRPNNELRHLCDKQGVLLVDTPDTMRPLFEKAEMIIAPIFEGGGMKVKIAEAMSYGLPIITTSHGIIGYKLENNSNCFVANEIEEFVLSIKKYYNYTEKERYDFLKKEWEFYCKYYSLEAIKNRCADIFEI